VGIWSGGEWSIREHVTHALDAMLDKINVTVQHMHTSYSTAGGWELELDTRLPILSAWDQARCQLAAPRTSSARHSVDQ
jgi:hypothetical protein